MSILPQTGNDFLAALQPPTFQRTTYGKTYHFDFDAGDFVVVAGKVEQLDFTDMFSQAVEKIWRTERYRFLAYGAGYGSSVITVGRAGDDNANLLIVHLANAAADGVRSHPLGRTFTDVDITPDDPNTPTEVQIQGDAADTFGAITAMDVTIPIAP